MEIDLTKKTPDVRRLDEMQKVVFDQEWFNAVPNPNKVVLYSMYRNLEAKDGLRYDITVIPAKMLGKEFVKTKGHTHVGNFGEIYIVLEGEGLYLLQNFEEGRTEDAYAINAKKGDIIIVPPGYGHVTINPSKDTELKMANWVAESGKNDFSLFESKQGACYYFTKEGWVKNDNYKNVPELRTEEPTKSMPSDLSFLRA